jgi:hypothetical protein
LVGGGIALAALNSGNRLGSSTGLQAATTMRTAITAVAGTVASLDSVLPEFTTVPQSSEDVNSP